MSSLELFPTSQLIHLKPQHTVAKPAEHSDDKRGDSPAGRGPGQRGSTSSTDDVGRAQQASCTAHGAWWHEPRLGGLERPARTLRAEVADEEGLWRRLCLEKASQLSGPLDRVGGGLAGYVDLRVSRKP